MSDERRRERRAKIAMKVRLMMGGAGRQLEGHAVDISLGGIFVASNDRVPVGRRVELLIESPVGVIATSGTVTHSVPGYGLGVRFAAQNPRTVELIETLLRRAEDTDVDIR